MSLVRLVCLLPDEAHLLTADVGDELVGAGCADVFPPPLGGVKHSQPLVCCTHLHCRTWSTQWECSYYYRWPNALSMLHGNTVYKQNALCWILHDTMQCVQLDLPSIYLFIYLSIYLSYFIWNKYSMITNEQCLPSNNPVSSVVLRYVTEKQTQKSRVKCLWSGCSIPLNQQAESLTKGPDSGSQPSQYDQDQSYRSGHPTPAEDAHPWTSCRTETYTLSVQDENVYLKK